jgi:cytochrome c peroxidase
MRFMFVAVLTTTLLGCSTPPPPPPPATPPPAPAAVAVDAARLTAFAPLPAAMLADGQQPADELVALGRKLFFEKRLSATKDVSCNDCHGLATFGVDNKPRSEGVKKQLGGRNSPSVYNAAGHLAQFWDGRAATIEDQAKGPILNPVEMAMKDGKAVEKTLKGIPEYAAAFKSAFPGQKDPITFDNYAKAVGAFERKLVTPARWDKFLAGDAKALTDAEKKGFNTFVDVGCTTCHAGPYVGGAMYQKIGLVKPWPEQKDLGRYEVTKQESDKQFFKVPSLRNIEKTAPYFHDGSEPSLEAAVKRMASHQLARELTDTEVASIVTWLRALTGQPDESLIANPAMGQTK